MHRARNPGMRSTIQDRECCSDPRLVVILVSRQRLAFDFVHIGTEIFLGHPFFLLVVCYSALPAHAQAQTTFVRLSWQKKFLQASSLSISHLTTGALYMDFHPRENWLHTQYTSSVCLNPPDGIRQLALTTGILLQELQLQASR